MHEAGKQAYSSTWLGYAKNMSTVTYVIGETWEWDETPGCPTLYEITYGREFRYDGPRQRYLLRALHPADLESGIITATSETWSDYDGDAIYSDFSISEGPDVTIQREYEAGVAYHDPPSSVLYYHLDAMGSKRFFSNSSGGSAQESEYTAFGELADGYNLRFGYAGAWGYQKEGAFPFLHLGARYYDPATGRFLQRDPIGIDGGINVYEYVGNNPLTGVDPNGQYPDWHFQNQFGHTPGFNPNNISPAEGPTERFFAYVTGCAVGGPLIVAASRAKRVFAAVKVIHRKARRFARWMNRGKFRIGPSYNENRGSWYFSIRVKKWHRDLFKIKGPYG